MRRKVGGYVFREQCTRAQNASRATRESLRELIEAAPGPQRAAMLIAKAAVAQLVVQEALHEIESIAGRHD